MNCHICFRKFFEGLLEHEFLAEFRGGCFRKNAFERFFLRQEGFSLRDVHPRPAHHQRDFPRSRTALGGVAPVLERIAVASGRAGAPIGTNHGSSSLSIFQGHYTPVPETVDRFGSFYVLYLEKLLVIL